MSHKAACLCILILVAFPRDAVPEAGQLVPRVPYPKPARIQRLTIETTLTVKFRDKIRARARGGDVVSLAGQDVPNVRGLASQLGLTFEPLVRLSEETLSRIESYAAQRSGRAQPDLAGMIAVYGPEHRLEAAAMALLAMDTVEWAYTAQVLSKRRVDREKE